MQTETVFHPEQLIPFVHAQHPLRRDVIRALQLCNPGQWINSRVVQLVVGERGQPVKEQLIIQTAPESSMILDVLWDGRISRIEFL